MNHVTSLATTFARRSFVVISAAFIVGGFFVSTASAVVSSIDVVEPGSTPGQEHKFPFDIEWDADASPGDTVDIYYSTNDFVTSTKLTASALAFDLGTYEWDPVVQPADNTTYKVRVQSTTNAIQGTSVNEFTIDNTPPSTVLGTDVDPDIGTGWYNIATGKPTITLTCSDATSGCGDVFYRWGDVGAFTNGGASPVTIVPGDVPEGITTLYFYSEDQAIDNTGAHNVEAEDTQEFKVDTTAPDIDSYTLNGSTDTVYFNPAIGPDVEISITADEEVTWTTVRIREVGGSEYKERHPGTVGTTVDTSWVGDLTTAGPLADGAFELFYTIEDVAGNVVTLGGPLGPHQIVVDTVAPSIDDFSSPAADSVHKDSSDTNTADALTFEVSDTNPLSCFYSVESGANVPTDAACVSAIAVVNDTVHGLTDGRQSIELVVSDAAGNTATSSAVSFVFDNNDTLTVGAGGEDFTTIQGAIDKATDGDTIAVSAGTYDEQLDIDKDVTISGADMSTTIIQPTAAPVLGTFDIKFDAGSSGSTLENFTLDFNSTDGLRSGLGIVVSDFGGPTVTDVTIQNNEIFMGLGEGAATVGKGVGIQTGKDADVSGLLITGNEFHGDPTDTGDGLTNGGEGVYINPNAGAGPITVSDNTFDGHLFTGISIESSDVTVSGNTLTQLGPTITNTQGIRLNDFVGGETYDDIVITDNAVSGFENGVRLGSAASGASTMTVSVTENIFTGNTTDVWVRFDTVPTINDNSFSGGTYGVNNISGDVVDAVHNWWGSNEGPTPDTASLNPNGDGVGMSNDVDFIPWCTESDCSTTDTTAPTAALTNPPSDPDNVENPSFIVDTTDTAYYRYQLNGGGYGPETAVSDPIEPGPLSDATTYTLDIIARDQAGNWQAEVDATEYEWDVDLTPPNLGDLRIASNNAKDGTMWAKEGDIITITATSSEAVTINSATIAGNAADSITGGPTEWYITYTMQAGDPEGVIAFSIEIEDTAGNVVTETTTTDASAITYDETAPTVDAGDDNETNTTFTQSTASASDDGSGLDFVLWTQESGPGVVTFTTSATIMADISSDTDGVYTLRLTAEDEAGNTAFGEMTLLWDTLEPKFWFMVPAHDATGVDTAPGTLDVHFRQDNGAGSDFISLLNDSRVFLEDGSGADVVTGVAVEGGDGTSTVLNVDYDTLTGGTTYCLTILEGALTDAAGNVMEQDIDEHCFTTEIDTTAPLILSVQVSNVDSSSADITVTTNESAVCRISDTPEAYGDMDPFDTGDTTHEVALIGLDSDTLYDFSVRCRDDAGNESAEGDVIFATDVADTDAPPAPVITTGSQTVNSSTFVVSGTAGADTPVDDGQEITIYNNDTDDVLGTLELISGQTSWSIVIALPGNATTTLVATSVDFDGNESADSNTVEVGNFDTFGVDATAPETPVITTVTNTVDANQYTIEGTITADEGTVIVSVYNGATLVGTASVPAGETSWSLFVPLEQSTTNDFTATASDAVGNTSAASGSVTITESPDDSSAPNVSVEASNIATDSADIDITVDESAICRVGTSDVVFASLPNLLSPAATSHTYNAAGLNDGTTYDYYVRCQDDALNTSESAHVSFTTLSTDSTGPTIQGIQATAIGTDSVTITWTTDEDSDSQVEYGTDSGYGATTVLEDTPVSPDGVTSHSVTIIGLDSQTTYHFRVISSDADGNTTTSGDNVFDTIFDDSTAILEVTNISAIKTFATADDTYPNGWSWIFYITVPTIETEFAMKFADFISGANTIAATDNIRYYTPQSSEAADDTDAVTITGADTYPGAITLDSDLDDGEPGRQIAVTVEMKVPAGSAGGSYSAQYGVLAEEII